LWAYLKAFTRFGARQIGGAVCINIFKIGSLTSRLGTEVGGIIFSGSTRLSELGYRFSLSVLTQFFYLQGNATPFESKLP